MIRNTPNLLAAGLLAIPCWAMAVEPTLAQASHWEELMVAGEKAYQGGRYAEAEQQFKAALKEAETFGSEDPRLARSLNDLAALYQAQGNYAQAEPLYKRSLAIDEKALGANHPAVAGDLNNLAEVYRAQGNYAQAEPLYIRSLAIREKALGPEHPNVATSLENYAALLRKMSRNSEAEKMEARAKAIRAKHGP